MHCYSTSIKLPSLVTELSQLKESSSGFWRVTGQGAFEQIHVFQLIYEMVKGLLGHGNCASREAREYAFIYLLNQEMSKKDHLDLEAVNQAAKNCGIIPRNGKADPELQEVIDELFNPNRAAPSDYAFHYYNKHKADLKGLPCWQVKVLKEEVPESAHPKGKVDEVAAQEASFSANTSLRPEELNELIEETLKQPETNLKKSVDEVDDPEASLPVDTSLTPEELNKIIEETLKKLETNLKKSAEDLMEAVTEIGYIHIPVNAKLERIGTLVENRKLLDANLEIIGNFFESKGLLDAKIETIKLYENREILGENLKTIRELLDANLETIREFFEGGELLDAKLEAIRKVFDDGELLDPKLKAIKELFNKRGLLIENQEKIIDFVEDGRILDATLGAIRKLFQHRELSNANLEIIRELLEDRELLDANLTIRELLNANLETIRELLAKLFQKSFGEFVKTLVEQAIKGFEHEKNRPFPFFLTKYIEIPSRGNVYVNVAPVYVGEWLKCSISSDCEKRGPLEEWIYHLLALAEGVGTDTERQELQEAVNDLQGKLGLRNALALVLCCYQLSYHLSLLGSEEQKKDSMESFQVFQNLLHQLMKDNFFACLNLNLRNLKFNPEELSPDFRKYLYDDSINWKKVGAVFLMGAIAVSSFFRYLKS